MLVTVTPNPCMDLNWRVDRFSFEEPCRTLEERKRPGGKGVNVSAGLACLDVPSCCLTFSDGGDYPRALERLMEGAPVQLEWVPISGRLRSNLVLTEVGGGKQIKVNQKGPELGEKDWQEMETRLDNRVGPGDRVVLAGSLPPGLPESLYARWTERYQDRGALVVVDGDGAVLREAVEAGPFAIKPNREELGRLVGKSLSDDSSIHRALGEVHQKGVPWILLSGGKEAAWLSTRAGRWRSQPPEVHGSPTGAGDAFLAGFLAAWHKRGEGARHLPDADGLQECLRWAVASGSAMAGLPDTVHFTGEQAAALFEKIQVEPVSP